MVSSWFIATSMFASMTVTTEHLAHVPPEIQIAITHNSSTLSILDNNLGGASFMRNIPLARSEIHCIFITLIFTRTHYQDSTTSSVQDLMVNNF